MPARFARTAMLIGPDGLAKLEHSRVAVFGLGGVGSFAVEGLARAGIGELYLVDCDVVDVTNINRQIHALEGTVGRPKAELMAERVKQINPRARVTALQERYVSGEGERLIPPGLDYLVDAIDDVANKADLIIRSLRMGIPVISAMGAGNKLDPRRFEVTDISRTSVCPLARVIRRKLRAAGIVEGVKVVYSTEKPVKPGPEMDSPGSGFLAPAVVAGYLKARRSVPGSISFVPSVAGLIIAGEVVKDLLTLKRGPLK
ncbi:MAG: tRNA threonylcarbamoyladenosine dehydratase [Peptococcaceae bacterium]|nr:tRNA threonylcarbamoyladenosine dehydratase [Peptococcaceae bacterium]